jgi:redox-sensitive bicupin YhaK (pirin superfamily)
LQGFVDHSDSHGQAGRYGEGDVQWMTAGSGLQHCEMFPLLNQDKENTAELFQIWLNLPKAKKLVDAHYKMLWSEDIPLIQLKDEKEKLVEIKLIAGSIGDVKALPPAPDSWAADASNEVGIWLIKMEENAEWKLTATDSEVKRTLYFYKGSSISVNSQNIASGNALELRADEAVNISNKNETAYMILLQAKPIDETVVQYGPFVMNTEAEIQQAFNDYRKTEFGGWPWSSKSMVFPRNKGRFALYGDGREEVRPK